MKTFLRLALCVAFAFSFTASEAHALRTIAGVKFGVSLGEAQRLLRQQLKNGDARFVETICNIPLGFDFYNGARFFTTDTGVTMQTYTGFAPLYFYKGKLFGMKLPVANLDEFLALKQLFPQGRFFLHHYPFDARASRVFEAHDGKVHAFTNTYNDLIVLDASMREEIMASIKGTMCWHTKSASPNLKQFVGEYEVCMRRAPSYDASMLLQDLDSCKRFCADTPKAFASPDCAANCEQAYVRAQDAGRAQAQGAAAQTGKSSGQ